MIPSITSNSTTQENAFMTVLYTVPKEIDFPRYSMNCSGESVILRGIFHAVSCFPLHSCYTVLHGGNLDYFFGQCTKKHGKMSSLIIFLFINIFEIFFKYVGISYLLFCMLLLLKKRLNLQIIYNKIFNLN